MLEAEQEVADLEDKGKKSHDTIVLNDSRTAAITYGSNVEGNFLYIYSYVNRDNHLVTCSRLELIKHLAYKLIGK